MREAASSSTDSGQAFQERDALGERGGEIDFAIHRPPGDLGDMGAPPDEIGQFVEHLVLDDGRFEIGDEHALAAAGRRLDHDVDRGAADRPAGSSVGRLPGDAGEAQIAGRAGGEPVRRAGERQRRGQRGDQIGQATRGAGSGDDGHHEVQCAASSAGPSMK